MDKTQIKKARQTNLAQYLIGRGEKLISTNGRYRHAEHNSLVFTKNAYYWNARGEHGNAVDFLISFYGMSFETAVTELTGKDFAGQQKKESIQPLTEQTFSFTDVKITRDMRRAIAYLNKTRCIDTSIIQRLMKEKYIFQEVDTNNLIFPIYDELRQTVGAETAGTLSNRRYKGVKEDSKYGYGFNIPIGESFQYALFFESAIDLISFIEIEQKKRKSLNGCLLVSLAGLKESIIEHTLNVFKSVSDSLQPVLCVDNDTAGQNFIERLRTQNKAIKIHLPDSPFKDWNEQLQAMKGGGK